MVIDNITYLDFVNSDNIDEILFVIKYSKQHTTPINHYRIRELTSYPFGLIKDFQYDLETNSCSWDILLKYISNFTDKEIAEIAKEKMITLCQFKSYLFQEMEKLVTLESKALAHQSTWEEEEAGIDLFEGFNQFLQIDSLALGDVTKHSIVRLLPYDLCFTKLVAMKQTNEFQSRLSKIHSRNVNK